MKALVGELGHKYPERRFAVCGASDGVVNRGWQCTQKASLYTVVPRYSPVVHPHEFSNAKRVAVKFRNWHPQRRRADVGEDYVALGHLREFC